jgi:hypothetical protein
VFAKNLAASLSCTRSTKSAKAYLGVGPGQDRLLLRRGDDVVEVLPAEVWHLVDALVEGATRVVDRKVQD